MASSIDVIFCDIVGTTNKLFMVKTADNLTEHIALKHVTKISKELFEGNLIVRLCLDNEETVTLKFAASQLVMYTKLIQEFGEL